VIVSNTDWAIDWVDCGFVQSLEMNRLLEYLEYTYYQRYHYRLLPDPSPRSTTMCITHALRVRELKN
jgi:hypothetical protein